MKVHKENASTRGKAMRRAPIMSGTSQLPRGPTTTDEAIIIMIVPCSLTIEMYVPGTEYVVRRTQQLGPDRHGEEAAGEEEEQHADHVLHARRPCGRGRGGSTGSSSCDGS